MSESTSPWKETRSASSPPEDPVERLWRLWQRGGTPDVDAYLAGTVGLTLGRKVAALCVDQRERWQRAERVPAEDYFRRHPDVVADTEAAVDLVFNEFLIRERLGEQPAAHEYLDRFPEYAGVLRGQFELHEALACVGADTTRVGTVASGGAADATANAGATADITPPEEFGRYRIVGVIGRGGMGAVYRARDTGLDRVVALKVPHFNPAEGRVRFERFAREARAAAALDHPNLCPVYEVGEIGGIPYFTMPLLAGEPLSSLLQREGRLDERVAIGIAVKVARAVHAAHAAGVVHRDLKPANVMIKDGGEPVVMDFGLARRVDPSEARLTEPGVLLGTAGYMPPEQVCGDPDAGGPAGDVYSLGVILFEMLTGRLPFEGRPHEVVLQSLRQSPEPPSRFRPGLDGRLDAVCLKAIANESKDRFPSMGAFADALENCLAGASAPAGSEGRAGGRRPRRATRRALLAVLALAVLAAVFTAGKAFFAGRPVEKAAPSGAERPSPADAVRPGSRWEGYFRFAPGDRPMDVVLTVAGRSGDRFTGEYATENGKFRWAVEGTVDGEAVSWRFTRAILEPMPTGVVETASVRGKLLGDTMRVTFRDADSVVSFDLVRR